MRHISHYQLAKNQYRSHEPVQKSCHPAPQGFMSALRLHNPNSWGYSDLLFGRKCRYLWVCVAGPCYSHCSIDRSKLDPPILTRTMSKGKLEHLATISEFAALLESQANTLPVTMSHPVSCHQQAAHRYKNSDSDRYSRQLHNLNSNKIDQKPSFC